MLTRYLNNAGVEVVRCSRLKAKPDVEYKTPVFYVSCEQVSRDLLCDKATWPNGVELIAGISNRHVLCYQFTSSKPTFQFLYKTHGFKFNWHYLQHLLDYNDVVFVHWLPSCYLHYLHTLRSDFLAYGQSSMDEIYELGLLRGRPFGGVAAFVMKSYKRMISLSSSTHDGRVIMAALCNRGPLYFCPVVSFFFFFFFFSSPNLSGRRSDVCHTSTHGVALVRI